MKIPTNFKPTIAAVFYDKTVTVYSTIDTKDAVGWARKAGTTVVTGTFKGNVNFSKLEKIQEDYGISEKIDIVITTDEDVELETILGYRGKQYKVIRSIPFDTHNLLFAQKWSSKSLTSISL